MSSRHRSSLLGDAFASRFGRRRSSVARAPKPPLAATAVPQYVIDITAPPPDEELAEEQLGEEKEEEQPLPPFSASWSALAPFALLYAPLPKYYPASSLRIFSSARQWKDRHVLLSGPDATGVIPGHLHLFKGPAPDDRELERLELNADSVVFIAEQPGLHQQERKAHAHFVRVAGKDVGSRRKDWNPTDDAARTVWFLQFHSSADAQRWISSIKSAISTRGQRLQPAKPGPPFIPASISELHGDIAVEHEKRDVLGDASARGSDAAAEVGHQGVEQDRDTSIPDDIRDTSRNPTSPHAASATSSVSTRSREVSQHTRRPSLSEALGPDIDSHCPPIMVPLLHGLSLLQSAVRANRVSHFQPSTARIISCVRSVLSATDTLVRDAPILNRFPALAQERRGILSVLALLVSQAEKASDETPDEEIQEAQVDAMVQLGGQVFANVRGFLAVAVQCGVELPERRQSVGSIAGSTDTEGHSWINSESFEARTVSYGHEASGSYGLDGFQARTTTPRKVVHANQGSALRARSMVDLRRSSRTSAEDDSDSVVPLLPNDINVPVKTIEEQYLFKERVLRHRAAVRSVNTTSFSLEYTSTPARPSFSVGPSTTASHHPTSTPAQAESSSALLSSSSASVVSVRSARSDKSSSLARKDSLHDDSASTCSGASVSPRGTSFPPSAFIPAAGYQTASSYLSGAPPSLRLNRTSTYGPSSAAARRALPIGARNVTAGGPPAAGANLGLTSVSRRPTPLTLNLRRSNPSLDLSPTRRWASSSGRSTPSSIGIYRPGNRRRESRNSSDGRASAWMSLFTATDSDPGSDDESPLGSPSSPHTSPGEWDFPSYNLSSHQLLLEDLDLTGTVDKLDKYPFESGGVADIHRGTVKSSTLQVAVKIFRRMHSDQETLERTCRHLYQEARIWRQLDHPNILPFLGISLDLGLSPALISPLCASGSIMKYLQETLKNSKERLQMVIGVANGLAYLHSEGIVHGNFCTKKILINDDGLPVICGYGMSQTLHQPALTASLFLAPIRFASPECFSEKDNTSSSRTPSGDVYAFSMVALEVLSGLQPYHHLPSEHAVFIHIIRGGRPVRTHLDPLAITNGIWRFLTSMWDHEPASRPEMPQVIQTLTRMRDREHMRDEEDYTSELESTSSHNDAVHLSSGSEASDSRGDISLPEIDGRDLKGRITQDDQYPFAGGGNSNIYRGKLTRSNGRKIRVAIKMIRMSDDGSGHLEEVLRRLRREVDVWARLKHRNVLPFIGVCDDLAPWPVLISPFYKFGHVQTYLRKHPSTNRQNLVRGVASGLQYLHAHDIVHGDLKVQNVLVDKRGTALICDFGISKIINGQGYTTASVGTAPYMAPELFFIVDGAIQDEASPSITKCSDVYSFALLVLEILTSEPPKGRPTRPVISAKVFADLRPKQSDYDEHKVKPEMWSVLNRCWAFEPQQRPLIFEVLRELKSIFQSNPVESGGLETESIRSVDGHWKKYSASILSAESYTIQESPTSIS